MKLCLITDEISADPETAVELGMAWGVRDFELRGVFTDRVPRLTPYQRRHIGAVLDDYGARVVVIAPGLFKIPCPPARPPRTSLGWMDQAGYESWAEAHRQLRYHMEELLPRSLEYANELGAELVVVFGFDRAGQPPGEPPAPVLDCLRQAAERAAAAQLELAMETEAGFWADTGARSARLLGLINHPALKLNWDPGNSFCAGDVPFPDGYAAVRRWVRHVHFKDARRDGDGAPAYVAEGQIDWAGQIGALLADDYSGYISIETHLRPKVAQARRALDRVRGLIATAGTRPEAQHPADSRRR
jgi:sugar phosphate isomerase/epimerase